MTFYFIDIRAFQNSKRIEELIRFYVKANISRGKPGNQAGWTLVKSRVREYIFYFRINAFDPNRRCATDRMNSMGPTSAAARWCYYK